MVGLSIGATTGLERRGRDSNPRTDLNPLQHFQCCSFGHSDTSPGFHRGRGILGAGRVGFHALMRALETFRRVASGRAEAGPAAGAAGVAVAIVFMVAAVEGWGA